VSTYQMTYGDGPRVVETFHDVEVEREDGWVVLFRGLEAILRVREENVHELKEISEPAGGRPSVNGS